MHILPQGKCCYRPRFKSYKKLLLTIYAWVSFLPWCYIREKYKVDQSCWGEAGIVYGRHIKASSDFAARILADKQHPLYEELSKEKSHTSTKSSFKLLPSKTYACRSSFLPAQSRLWVDWNAELNMYIQERSWWLSSSTLVPNFLIAPCFSFYRKKCV